MVPGFMNLLQDDQIMLLKGGSFEIALLRLTRAYDVQTNSVIFGHTYIPLDAFSGLSEYKRLLFCIFKYNSAYALHNICYVQKLDLIYSPLTTVW